MTKQEAISLLRRYRRNQLFKPSPRLARLFRSYRENEYISEIWARFLVRTLIQRIQQASNGTNPIEVVRDFYYQMDDVLCESENPRIWAFASTMENEAGDILRYLRRKEREGCV